MFNQFIETTLVQSHKENYSIGLHAVILFNHSPLEQIKYRLTPIYYIYIFLVTIPEKSGETD